MFPILFRTLARRELCGSTVSPCPTLRLHSALLGSAERSANPHGGFEGPSFRLHSKRNSYHVAVVVADPPWLRSPRAPAGGA